MKGLDDLFIYPNGSRWRRYAPGLKNMTYTHLRDLIIKYKGDKKYVLDRLLAEKLEVTGKWYVKDWPEPYYPPFAPVEYVDFIRRLDGQHFEYEGCSCDTENRIESSGRIYTTLIFDDGRSINYQSLKEPERRSFLSNKKALEIFDVSASQLRVALALRGVLLPFVSSPWDDLVPEAKHGELLHIDPAARRKVVKRIALMAVKQIRKIDVKAMWKEEVGVAPKVDLKGLKGEVERALFAVYPDLKKDLPLFEVTPDGYLIRKERLKHSLSVKCRPLKIDTKYFVPEYGKPDENNIIEAIEGWILRSVINSLPSDAPILTCHDEILTYPEYISLTRSKWKATLDSIVEIYKN